jgi:hypothetical protein
MSNVEVFYTSTFIIRNWIFDILLFSLRHSSFVIRKSIFIAPYRRLPPPPPLLPPPLLLIPLPLLRLELLDRSKSRVR